MNRLITFFELLGAYSGVRLWSPFILVRNSYSIGKCWGRYITKNVPNQQDIRIGFYKNLMSVIRLLKSLSRLVFGEAIPECDRYRAAQSSEI